MFDKIISLNNNKHFTIWRIIDVRKIIPYSVLGKNLEMSDKYAIPAYLPNRKT